MTMTTKELFKIFTQNKPNWCQKVYMCDGQDVM